MNKEVEEKINVLKDKVKKALDGVTSPHYEMEAFDDSCDELWVAISNEILHYV